MKAKMDFANEIIFFKKIIIYNSQPYFSFSLLAKIHTKKMLHTWITCCESTCNNSQLIKNLDFASHSLDWIVIIKLQSVAFV
jgi:hypothetical protein